MTLVQFLYNSSYRKTTHVMPSQGHF